MDLGLTDRRALVTGATRGLGRAMAEALAAEGAVVAVTGRKAADAERAAREIGGGARGYTLDLADDGSLAAAVAALEADLGGLDILVLNSGGPPPGPITGVTFAGWEAQFRAMMLSFFRLTEAFLPGMRARGWGRILVSSSSGAVQPQANLGLSNTLRAGLLGWAKSLANEVAGDGVTVNTILPGRIHTGRVDEIDAAAATAAGRTVDEIAAASRAQIPIGRYGRVEEYGAVAAFLVSDKASYLTGVRVAVDGGMVRGI